jgi:hypothetical protein
MIFERFGLYDGRLAAEQRKPRFDAPGRYEYGDRLISLTWWLPCTFEFGREFGLPRANAFVVAIDRHDEAEISLITTGTK